MHLTLNVHDKNTQHSRNIRKLPQSDKRTLQKPIANITLNGESLNVFSYIKNKTRMSALATFIQYGTKHSNQSN